MIELAALPFFAVAAYYDQRTRLVPSAIWLPPLVIGLAALALDPSALPEAAASVALLGGVGAVLHRAGSFGLADVKALVVVAVAFPVAPPWALVDGWLPLFPLAVLLNTTLLSLLYPASLAVRNMVRGEWGRGMASKIEVTPADIGGVHGWVSGTGEDVAECDPDGPVDVVPGVPYLVPLLAGLLVSLIIGDPTGI